MNDSVREVQGDEAKLVMAEFLGQSMSFLKEIDRNITNRTNTLQGVNINPMEIINKLPGGLAPGQTFVPPSNTVPPPTADVNTPPIFIPPPVTVMPTATVTPTSTMPPAKDQMEFTFDYDVAEDIAKQLTNLNKRVAKIETDIATILSYIESKNKKKVDKLVQT